MGPAGGRSQKTGAKKWCLLVTVLLARPLWPQVTPAPVYVESFRKRPVKIEEKTFQVNLDATNPNYQGQLKDSEGNDRYKLSLTPMKVGSGDDRILSWRVTLVDTKHPVFGDLLLPARNPDLNEGREGHVARLDANPYALIPLTAKRVIKVDEFYCVLQVQKYHLLVPERSYVDSISVEVKFTNKNPMAGTEKN
jgi:hypothetical protein